jgi:hypothetical protein
MLRKAPIKAKTPIPNMPTTVEDVLSEVPEEKPTPAKDDKTFPTISVEDVLSEVPEEEKPTPAKDDETFPTISAPPLPIKQTIWLIGRILSISKIPLYYAFYYALWCGISALVAIYAFGVVLTVAQSVVCAPPAFRSILPFCGVKIDPSSHVEFEKLGNLQAMLEEVQEASAGGVTLPLLMKRGENAVREVVVNVELSNIPSK